MKSNQSNFKIHIVLNTENMHTTTPFPPPTPPPLPPAAPVQTKLSLDFPTSIFPIQGFLFCTTTNFDWSGADQKPSDWDNCSSSLPPWKCFMYMYLDTSDGTVNTPCMWRSQWFKQLFGSLRPARECPCSYYISSSQGRGSTRWLRTPDIVRMYASLTLIHQK